MGFVSLFLIGPVVLLVILIIQQGSLSRKIDEGLAEVKKELYKVAKALEEERAKKQSTGEVPVPPMPEQKQPISEEKQPVKEKQSIWGDDKPVIEGKTVWEEIKELQEALQVAPVVPEEPPVYKSVVIPEVVQETSDVIVSESETVHQEPPVVAVSQEPPAVPSDILSATSPEIPLDVPPAIPASKISPASARPVKKEVNYEKLIGENLFGKIGILVFVVGVGLFVKYAIDKDWINETMRTVLGFLVGSLLLFIAERLREKYRTFSSLLAGGAFAVFYLTVSIAFHYYHLFSQTVAFVILVIITMLMSVLAILYDRRELAIIALVGGFLAPFIVSTGTGNYVILFTYIAVLNIGMFILSVYKKWAELPVLSFVFTYVILGLFILNSYFFGGREITITMAQRLFGFALLFYFIFFLPVMLILKTKGVTQNRVLLSVIIANNFLFLGFGCLFLHEMALSFRSEGLLSLFIAIVNLLLALWLKKNEGDYRFLLYTMIGLVLTFVSITVPLQLDGHYITLFWASEMVLLLWLYVRSQIRVYEYAAFIMVLLTGISFVMDIEGGHAAFATNLFTAVASGVFAWLMVKYREALSEATLLTYKPWNAVMWIVAVAVFYYAFMEEFNSWNVYYVEQIKLLFSVACIGGVSVAFRNRFPIGKYSVPYLLGIGLSVLCSLLGTFTSSNGAMAGVLSWASVAVIAATLYYVGRMYYAHYGVTVRFTVYLNILAVVLWLSAIHLFLYQAGVWGEGNAAFSIGLAIAGFVQMLLGMRLHQKVLRMISLVVFGIVLGKLALVDLWALPTIGKIIVFIMLGALLLVLSFLYQKLKNVLFKDDDREEDIH